MFLCPRLGCWCIQPTPASQMKIYDKWNLKSNFFPAYFWSQSRRKSEKTSIRAFPKSTRHNAPQEGWKLVGKMLMNGDQEVILFPQFNTLVTLPSKILQTFLIGCERKNSGQVCGRLSSIPGRCIIPEGIYALDFFPNHSKIPHSWHHQKVIKSLICVCVNIALLPLTERINLTVHA